MNDIYGIDPDAPSSKRDLAELLRLFRSGEERFIAAYPNNWPSAIGASSRWSDSQKHLATVFAEQIKRVLIPVRPRGVLGATWAENARHLQSCGVGSLLGVDGCAAPIVPLQDALEDLNLNAFPDARGGHVSRQVNDYIRTAEPLFRLSTKVALVDPFFGLWRKTKNGDVIPDHPRRQVLTALLKCAAHFGRVACFKVILSKVALPDDHEGASFEKEFLKIAIGAGARDVDLSYAVLEEIYEVDQHARYLLGNHHGLQFDHGFATDSRGIGKSKNHVHWMSESELAPLLDRFMVEDAAPTQTCGNAAGSVDGRKAAGH